MDTLIVGVGIPRILPFNFSAIQDERLDCLRSCGFPTLMLRKGAEEYGTVVEVVCLLYACLEQYCHFLYVL